MEIERRRKKKKKCGSLQMVVQWLSSDALGCQCSATFKTAALGDIINTEGSQHIVFLKLRKDISTEDSVLKGALFDLKKSGVKYLVLAKTSGTGTGLRDYCGFEARKQGAYQTHDLHVKVLDLLRAHWTRQRTPVGMDYEVSMGMKRGFQL